MEAGFLADFPAPNPAPPPSVSSLTKVYPLIPNHFHHNFPDFQFPKTAILDIDGKTEKVRPRADLFPFLPEKPPQNAAHPPKVTESDAGCPASARSWQSWPPLTHTKSYTYAIDNKTKGLCNRFGIICLPDTPAPDQPICPLDSYAWRKMAKNRGATTLNQPAILAAPSPGSWEAGDCEASAFPLTPLTPAESYQYVSITKQRLAITTVESYAYRTRQHRPSRYAL